MSDNRDPSLRENVADAFRLAEEKARRAERLAALTELAGDPFAQTCFAKSHSAAAVKSQFAQLANGEAAAAVVAVAGRIMAIRNSGMFLDLLDDSDRIQIFHNLKALDATTARLLELLDLGDIVGVTGTVRRTPRGELTVDAQILVVLAKALEPPPDKWHGLTNIDQRYRHRERDLVSSEKSRQVLRARSSVIRTMREWLHETGFMEAETPILHVTTGGALAKPFHTHHNALDLPLNLRIATELHLKRLVIGGLSEKIFEIGRIFRNEGISPKHNPEFTSIELYQAYVDQEAMMTLAEELVSRSCAAIHGRMQAEFQGVVRDYTPPWPRRPMLGLIKEAAAIDLDAVRDPDAARTLVQQKLKLSLDRRANWGQIVEAVFAAVVEPQLIQPTHVTDLPTDISPLAKASPGRNGIAARFESYVNGWEIANAFAELNDPREQRARFVEQAAQRAGGNEEAHPVDEDFLAALAFGMPPMGGLGIGIDRLVMLLTDSHNIREVIAFPTMRPHHEG